MFDLKFYGIIAVIILLSAGIVMSILGLLRNLNHRQDAARCALDCESLMRHGNVSEYWQCRVARLLEESR